MFLEYGNQNIRFKYRVIESSLSVFDRFIIERAKKLLSAIEKATEKIISGKDSDEVINNFGDKLV